MWFWNSMFVNRDKAVVECSKANQLYFELLQMECIL
jgi:hypothetical protein